MATHTTIGNNNGSYEITDGTGSIVTVGNGNDSIAISGGTAASITIGSGVDSVTANWGTANHLTIGSGNDSILVSGGSNNTITAGNGVDVINASSETADTIKAGGGNDTISAGAGSTVTAGNGVDIITAGGGSVITAGGGNETVTVGAGSGASITLGSGVDKVTVTGGKATLINVGSGNDTITVSGGSGNTITAGGGNSVITATTEANDKITTSDGTGAAVSVYAGASNTIVVGNGNDTVSLGANDTVTAGKGIDTFIIGTSGAPSLTAPTQLSVNEQASIALPITASLSAMGFGHDTITGFSTASFDKVAFATSQFASFAAVMADAKQVGANTVITADTADSVTLEGISLSSLTSSNLEFISGGSSGGSVLVTLSGIPAGVSLADSGGALTVSNGSVTLTTAQLAGLTLKAGGVTTATLTVTATNQATGTSVSQNIALTVNPAAPILGGATAATVSEGGTVTLGATDTAAYSDDTLGMVTITGLPNDLTAFSGGTYTASSGTWTGTAAQFNALSFKAGAAGTETIAISATSSGAAATTAHYTLNVLPAAPTLTAPASLAVSEDGSVALAITETPFSPNDPISITISGVPADATLSAGTNNGNGSWTLTPAQLAGLTLNAGQAVVTTLTVTATNMLGATASSTDSISLTVNPVLEVTLSTAGNLPVQQGQTLVASTTILGDSADAAAAITYQWQNSSDGGVTWTNVGGAQAGGYLNYTTLSSFLQLTEQNEGAQFRVQASFTDSAGNLIAATSAPTVAVADVTPEITVPFSYTVSDLSIVKNGTEIYDNTFGQAPPASPTIIANGLPTPLVFFTLGSTWTESGGEAVMSSAGVAPNTSVSGNVYDIALLNTNFNPSSSLGLKEGADFTVSSTFGLTRPPTGSYGMELTDGTPTHATDQLVRMIVAQSGGHTVVELVQGDLASNPQTNDIIASQTLTAAQLSSNNQIEFQLSHVANTSAVTGSFELLDNGTVTSTTTFANTAPIFLGGVDWTRVDIGAYTGPGVGLNVGAGQPPLEGQTLTASAATNDSDATINYQWQESSSPSFATFTDIGSNSASYVVRESDVGSFIRVVATTSDPDNPQSATAISQVTGSVRPAAPTLSAPAALTLNEDGTIALPIGVTPFSPNDPVSITIIGVPLDGTLSAGTNTGNTTWTLTPDQLAGLTLTVGEVYPAFNLTVIATNTAGQTASVTDSIALTVNTVAPTLAIAADTLAVNADGTVALGIAETPFDPRDAVSITISGVPADATLSAGTNNGNGTWTLTPVQLFGLTLTAGEATTANLTVTATNTEGVTASSSQSIALTVNPVLDLTLSTVGDVPVQQGQTLLASTTILGDSADAGAAINYQWQSSSDGGVTWSNVSGALPGAFGNATLSSFLQLTEQNEGEQFRVQASFTDSAGNLISATSAPTAAVADVTPEITVPFSFTVSDLSIVKNGAQIYNNTFSQAPSASSTILTDGVATPLVFLTLGGTWAESGGQAVMSSAGIAANGSVPGSVYDFALLGTNVDPASPLGLKESAAFMVSSTFGLTPPPADDYGMELTDGTATHGVDQLVRMIVTKSGGNTVVELVQADLVANQQAYNIIASQALTAAQLAGNNQISFQLSHAANTSAVTGSFELLDNGTVTSTTTFANTAPIFLGGVDWTEVDIGAFTNPGVGLNVAAGQSPVEGQTLTASAATNDSDATINYQWQESSSPSFATFTDIGSNSASYVVRETDIGSFIRVVATTSDPDNPQSATVISQVTGSVKPAAPTLSAPSLVTASNDGSVALPITVTPFDPRDPVAVTITGIPADATLSDSYGPLAVVGGAVTLTPAQLAGLTLTAGLTPATLTVTATNTAGTTASASETVLLTVNSGSAYLWGSFDFPAQPGSGVHIYAPSVNLNQADTAVGIFYGETSSNYRVNGPDAITDYALMLDPFLLPESGGPQAVETSTIASFPFRYSFVLPSIGPADFNGVAGIAIYETQSGGERYLNEVGVTQGTAGSPLMVGTPTQIETLSAPEENPVFVSYRTVSSGISAIANYSVAWDQYNPSAGTYTIDFQIFNGNGTASSAVETPLSLSGVGGVATLPAWYFRSGSGPSSLSPYTLAYARLDPATGDDVVQFQGYGLNGLPTATSFFISPDLSAYAPGATNLINLEQNPKTHTLVTSALRFAQFSSATGYELAVAWNEQVTDANGTHDQVEFAEYNLTTHSVVSQQTFQLADGLPQNINLSIANDIAVVEYGDNTATNLVEFNASGLQLGTLTVATTQEAQSITNFGDGRVGVVYDNLLDSSGTSQLVADVYDFRTSGVTIDDSGLNDGINKYVAGTQYNDAFIGENNVSNTYDYVGQTTTGPGPTDVFTGGGGTAWNVAILPDAQSNYVITTSNGSTTLANVGDPAHAGSLTLSNVQALAFEPAADPSGNNLNSLQATGNRLDIIGALPGGGEPMITISNGSTLELDTADSGTVSFAGPQGTLQLDQASGFTGVVAGFGALDQIDLAAIGFGANTTLGYAANNTGTGGTLTVSDGAHTASIALLGQYMAASFATASDGHGGTLITDPPVAAAQTLLAQPHA